MTAGAPGADGAATLEEARSLLARGELLAAHDLAHGLVDHPDPLTAVAAGHVVALGLARSGATERAAELARELAERLDALPATATGLVGDVLALRARVDKDRGRFRSAARRYEAAAPSAGAYALVNAATMWALAGDREQSRRLALAAQEACTGEDHWAAATRAEAALLLGDVGRAGREVELAGRRSTGRWAERATTRRQLEAVCGATGADPALLGPLANPTVFHYCGHMVDPPPEPPRSGPGGAGRAQAGRPARRFAAEDEPEVAARVAAAIAAEGLGIGFGALACGGDILVAEALLAAGGELHVVLPFEAEEFVALSVAPAGAGWVDRFHRCVEAAASVSAASDGAYLEDPEVLAFGSRVAMGEAVNLARALAAPVCQLAVYDGVEPGPGALAGTAVDVATWGGLGRRTVTVTVGDGGRPAAVGSPGPVAGSRPSRRQRALLFADVAGFSRLGDAQLPAFMDRVMGALGRAVDAHGEHVVLRSTWGDGLYLALDDVAAAAQCALALQEAFASVDLSGAGLGSLSGLRVGVHAGLAYSATDPVTGGPSVFGADVTRTARIEPRTPEGEVYATVQFAALLALVGAGTGVRCEYVGRMPTAKGYGELPMYRLTPRSVRASARAPA